MSDFWTLTNKDEVMDYLEDELWMTDYGYSLVKQDEAAMAEVINKVWKDDFEAYLENCWNDIKDNMLQELATQGYLTYEDN